MMFITGRTVVTTAATRVQVRNTNSKVLWAKFQGKPGNAAAVTVGDSTVSMTAGWTIMNSATIPATLELDFRKYQGSVLASSFWVDSSANGDAVEWAMIVE